MRNTAKRGSEVLYDQVRKEEDEQEEENENQGNKKMELSETTGKA